MDIHNDFIITNFMFEDFCNFLIKMSRSSPKENREETVFYEYIKEKSFVALWPSRGHYRKLFSLFFHLFHSIGFFFRISTFFHQIHIFLNLHQGKRNSRLTFFFFFWWKTLCFHHISCSCLLCMNINLDTIMTAAGHRNINFSHHLLLPFLTRMVIRNFCTVL